MNNTCKEYEEILMDIYYGEAEMSIEVEEHLKNCEGCMQFCCELQEMGETLSQPQDIPIDYGIIRNVMETAEGVEAKKSNIRELALFILLACGLLGGIAGLVMLGYAKPILYLQGILHMGLPLTLPLILWRRKRKEGYNV
ncbi:anti-sigma factor [Alkaliphilus hydrothermalis]|uniref:Zinc-finger domain-containing protein n=1 Tax=Alkaliphilus hydrothermalis TaxID=1482730 RepID=A0ABS2NMY1_9FIRM|nr:hypothetical protein [Alkaliphilus hydrothermalis]MBM7614290.1 hypothetical protein [Alkaliphilus hydrothermalis]